jgi:hypothetical protein
VSDIGVTGTFSSTTLQLYEFSLRGPPEAASCVSMNAANIFCSCDPMGVPGPCDYLLSLRSWHKTVSLYPSAVRHPDPSGAGANASILHCCACLFVGVSTKACHSDECREPLQATVRNTCLSNDLFCDMCSTPRCSSPDLSA